MPSHSKSTKSVADPLAHRTPFYKSFSYKPIYDNTAHYLSSASDFGLTSSSSLSPVPSTPPDYKNSVSAQCLGFRLVSREKLVLVCSWFAQRESGPRDPRLWCLRVPLVWKPAPRCFLLLVRAGFRVPSAVPHSLFIISYDPLFTKRESMRVFERARSYHSSSQPPFPP
jgi:hypothetical protein